MARNAKKTHRKSGLTPRENEVLDELKEKFAIGHSACIQCMVEDYWDMTPVTSEYPIYEKKQRKILRRLTAFFKDSDPASIPVFKGKGTGTVVWLMAIDLCALHKGNRQYKIIVTAADYEKVARLSVYRLEARMVSHEHRVDDAIIRYPEFKKRIRYVRANVPYLLGEEEDESKIKKQIGE